MQNLLEDLWFSYLIEDRVSLSDSENIIVKSSSEKRDKIYNTLNPVQKNAFDEYEENSNDICNIYEKHAFLKGVHFAVKFLIGAMEK
ncbi:MAG: hypothetical protein IJA02_11035 [Clostridia bacterium]|nr:hypothetical protein [Clostridia bacterium]